MGKAGNLGLQAQNGKTKKATNSISRNKKRLFGSSQHDLSERSCCQCTKDSFLHGNSGDHDIQGFNNIKKLTNNCAKMRDAGPGSRVRERSRMGTDKDAKESLKSRNMFWHCVVLLWNLEEVTVKQVQGYINIRVVSFK